MSLTLVHFEKPYFVNPFIYSGYDLTDLKRHIKATNQRPI